MHGGGAEPSRLSALVVGQSLRIFTDSLAPRGKTGHCFQNRHAEELAEGEHTEKRRLAELFAVVRATSEAPHRAVADRQNLSRITDKQHADVIEIDAGLLEARHHPADHSSLNH